MKKGKIFFVLLAFVILGFSSASGGEDYTFIDFGPPVKIITITNGHFIEATTTKAVKAIDCFVYPKRVVTIERKKTDGSSGKETRKTTEGFKMINLPNSLIVNNSIIRPGNALACDYPNATVRIILQLKP